MEGMFPFGSMFSDILQEYRFTMQTFTCSKSTVETFKKVWNMFKDNNKDTRTMSLTWKFLFSYRMFPFNPLSANSTKWSNTLKQFVGNLPTNCLSVIDHFVKLTLKGLMFSVFCSKRCLQILTWSKSTMESFKGVKIFKVNNEDTKTTSLTSFWCLYS